MRLSPPGTHFTAESTEAMRIKSLAQGENILMLGFEPSTFCIQNRHSNHYTNCSMAACGVLFLLRRFNPNKAQGPDELSPQLLKHITEELAPAKTITFQQSYNLSSTPKDWNSAIVTPIFKKGLKSDPYTNRPISHISMCCKIMEHIVLSHIAKHIAKNNIIVNEQHSFRNKLSTITQLINTTTD